MLLNFEKEILVKLFNLKLGKHKALNLQIPESFIMYIRFAQKKKKISECQNMKCSKLNLHTLNEMIGRKAFCRVLISDI